MAGAAPAARFTITGATMSIVAQTDVYSFTVDLPAP